jgi:hypothetical protein
MGRQKPRRLLHVRRAGTDYKITKATFGRDICMELAIDSFPGSVRGVGLLGGEALDFRCLGERLEITLPGLAPDPDVSVIVVEIET